jgi:hypothetical protein
MHIVCCRACGYADDIASMVQVGEARGFVKGYTCDCEQYCGGDGNHICYFELYCMDCAKVNGYDGDCEEDYSDEDWDDHESDTLYCADCAECIFTVDSVAGLCASCAQIPQDDL